MIIILGYFGVFIVYIFIELILRYLVGFGMVGIIGVFFVYGLGGVVGNFFVGKVLFFLLI